MNLVLNFFKKVFKNTYVFSDETTLIVDNLKEITGKSQDEVISSALLAYARIVNESHTKQRRFYARGPHDRAFQPFSF